MRSTRRLRASCCSLATSRACRLRPSTRYLLQAAGAELAVIEYNDGTGHPFWFARSMFGPLADLHGDKAVWKLLESGQHETARVQVDADIPLDVDTWEDYQQLLAND